MKQGARTDIVEISTMSQTNASELINVSRESVISAKKVLDQGSEELSRRIVGKYKRNVFAVLYG